MGEAARKLRLLAWKSANRLNRKPLAPLLRAVFRRLPRRSAWYGFVPTAAGTEDLTVHFDSGDPQAAVREAASVLERHGVVILRGLVESAAAEAARVEIEAFLRPFAEAQGRDRSGGELGGYVWQTGLERVARPLAHPNPVITFMDDRPDDLDAGVVSITEIEAIARREGLRSVVAILDSAAFKVGEWIVRAVFPTRAKVYQFFLNRSVVRPRTIHTDTLGEYYNMFTYLTDVEATDDGPFTYVPGSHRRHDLLAKGSFLLNVRGGRPKEFPELRERALAMLGPRGTVIIANQRGVHGAHPQAPGGYRAMLVVNFH